MRMFPLTQGFKFSQGLWLKSLPRLKNVGVQRKHGKVKLLTVKVS